MKGDQHLRPSGILIALQKGLHDPQQRLELHFVGQEPQVVDGGVEVVQRQLGDDGHFQLIRSAAHPGGYGARGHGTRGGFLS
jgi:hypothetical protein